MNVHMPASKMKAFFDTLDEDMGGAPPGTHTQHTTPQLFGTSLVP